MGKPNYLCELSYADLMFNHTDQGYIVLEVLYDANDKPVDIYYIEANPAANRMTGIELAGKRTSELDPNYEQYWFDVMGRIAKTGVAEKHELVANVLGVCYQFHAIKVGTPEERKVAVIYEDVTERKKAEKVTEALRKSVEQFRMFVTASSNLVYKMSADWKSMYTLNSEDMLADTEEVTSNWVDKYIPEQDRALVWQTIAKAINSKSIFELEHRVIKADGSIGWVCSRAVPVIDAKGEITEWLGAGNDITTKKEAEVARQISEVQLATELADTLHLQRISSLIIHENNIQKLYEEIVDAAVSIMNADAGSMQMYVSEKQALLLLTSRGFAPESARHWNWVNVESRSACSGALVDKKRFIIKDVETDDFIAGTSDLQAYRLSGIRCIQSTPLMSRNGNVVGMISTHWLTVHESTERELRLLDVLARQAADLIERKLAEEALRKSEERLQLAINGANIFTWDVNPETGETTHSANCDEVIGFKISKIPKENLVNIHPDDEKFVLQAVDEALKGVIPLNIEHRLINPQTKAEIWVKAQGRMAQKAGGESSFIGITQNITEYKLAEKMLKNYSVRLEQEVCKRTAELGQLKDLLQGTVDSSHDMIQVFKAVRGEQGKIIDFIWILNNATSEKINGSTPGESLLQRNPGVVPAGIFDHFVQVTETGIPQQYEINYTYEHFDGWYQQSVVKLDDGIATTSANISERKKTELELNESLNLLKNIYDTSLIGMLVFAPVRNDQGAITDFRFVTVNKEIERTSGRFDLVGKLYTDLYPGIRQMGLFDLMVTTMETGETGKMEYHYTYEGIDSWYSTMFVKGDDFLVCTNLDITERMQAEDERFRNYLLLQQSEELAGSGSWDFDILSEAFSWSDGMYRLFDLNKEVEIKPEIYLEYAIPESMPAAERIAKHIRNGDQDFEETIEINAGGIIKVLRIKGAVVNNNSGQLTRVLGVDLNITAVHNAERRLWNLETRQQQEIFQVTLNTQEEERRRISESLHNGVGQLLYGTRLAMNYLTTTSATENPDKFNKSKAYTTKLLTDSIKEIRRISHELMPTVLAEFGLNAAIKEVGEQLQDNILFDCQVLMGNVKLDNYVELAVFRTVQELMINVVKHSEATKAEVAVKADGKEVQIVIHDNGIGMQLATGNKPGIGLSSIRNKVAMLKGIINIQSVPGEGTTITINLPHQLEGSI